eukprot:TRINITY_DN6573_c0_g1_i1.p1 TRINITY_DN6573_c0_g1~~TRINITY_DN6573_c0_g1_i1.p1  ORF type:complete len:262 (+),score=57.07 TRINITY_DN6573_c0_g1_i1:99-884(+)
MAAPCAAYNACLVRCFCADCVLRRSYSSSFYTATMTAFGTTHALSVTYENSPSQLRYQKPVFFRDTTFCHQEYFALSPLLFSSFSVVNRVDFIRNSCLFTLMFFPAARAYGTIEAITLYLAGGAASNLAWMLQSSINPAKNLTEHDRNQGAAGGICAMAAACLLLPQTQLFRTVGGPAWPVAAGCIAERFWDEYGGKFVDRPAPEDPEPVMRQWGGALGGSFVGMILGLFMLRRRTGSSMVGLFYGNLSRGADRAAKRRVK